MKKEETKECPSCAMEIDKHARVCPICGHEFRRQSPTVTIIAVVLIIALVLWLVI